MFVCVAVKKILIENSFYIVPLIHQTKNPTSIPPVISITYNPPVISTGIVAFQYKFFYFCLRIIISKAT